MANNFFSPKVDFEGHIQSSGIKPEINHIPSMKLDGVEEIQPNFKDVISGLAGNLNQELNAPEKLLKSAMSGNSDVDIHDVMTAMAKADISISIATQITSKVIQSYDKIMQITV